MKPKTQKTREPADEVFRALIRTMGRIRHVLRPHFDRHDIGRAQFMALMTLAHAKERGVLSMSIGELSGQMHVRPPSMTTVVHKLQGQGLVEVKKSEADARSRDVSLTAKGWELRESMLNEHSQEVGKLMDCLSVAEQKSLIGLLDRMSDHMSKIESETAGAPNGRPVKEKKRGQESNK
jgi:DNA-binding MarR family transcriptional regulator